MSLSFPTLQKYLGLVPVPLSSSEMGENLAGMWYLTLAIRAGTIACPHPYFVSGPGSGLLLHLWEQLVSLERGCATKLTLLCSHGAFAGDGLVEGINHGSIFFR